LKLTGFINQHDGHAIAHRKRQLIGLADQFVL